MCELCCSVGKFVESENIIKLSWLPVKEHIEWQLLKLGHMAIPSRDSRSSAAMQLEIPLVSHIYQDQVAKSFNILPECVRNFIDFNQFSKMIFKLLMKMSKITFQLNVFIIYCILVDIF